MAITRGRVRGSAIPGVRVYYKPALRATIFRPPNVDRVSFRVLEINKKLIDLRERPEHPARKCGAPVGRKPLREFLACLSKEMMAIIKPLPLAELAPAYRELVEKKKVVVKGTR